MFIKPYFGFDYLKRELSPMFKAKDLTNDLFAGITVAFIAIPLSLAIAMASGVSAGVGLISAIVGGVLAALFGGTRLAVTGPAAAMAVIIAAAVEAQGFAGLLVICLICGLLQIICGVFRLGRYAKLVPLPVVAAFTAGIGFIIFIGQLPKALQLATPKQNEVIDVILYIGTYIKNMHPIALGLALLTLVILKTLPRYYPRIPTPLIAVAIPTIIVYYFNLNDIQLVGSIPRELPMPHLPDFSAIKDWFSLIEAALAVFALASLETLLSSSAVDNMGRGDMHNPNQELIGQGIANASVSLFGGIPVTGVIARSSVNLSAGGKTRRSAIFHSLVILAAVYLFPGLIEKIPVAALAGILLSAAISMMNVREFIGFWKTDRYEGLLYIGTFLAIVVTDLVEGVQIGFGLAFLIVAIRTLRTKSNVRLWTNQLVLRVSLSGGMTFWSFERLSQLQEFINEHSQLRFVIIELSDILGFDSSGASHILSTTQEITARGVKVILHGLSEKNERMLKSIDHGGGVYQLTHTEDEIKVILETSGIEHSAVDVLRQGVQTSLTSFAKERKQLLSKLAEKQNPHTLVITCSDSRLNPNFFLSAGLGELFIVRNVGNVVPNYSVVSNSKLSSEIAAIEFALSELKIRHIVICAHSDCGAIKAAMSNKSLAELPWLDTWLKLITDAFKAHKLPQNMHEGVLYNLHNQVLNLTSYPIVQQLIENKELTISTWIYDVAKASLSEYDGETNQLTTILMHRNFNVKTATL